MGKAARIKAQRTEKFEHEPKRPTGRYKTAKERQLDRRHERDMVQRLDALTQSVAAQIIGDRRG